MWRETGNMFFYCKITLKQVEYLGWGDYTTGTMVCWFILGVSLYIYIGPSKMLFFNDQYFVGCRITFFLVAHVVWVNDHQKKGHQVT